MEKRQLDLEKEFCYPLSALASLVTGKQKWWTQKYQFFMI